MDGNILTLPTWMSVVLVEIRDFTLSDEVKKRLLVESSAAQDVQVQHSGIDAAVGAASPCTTGIRTTKAVFNCQVILYRD
jgi:hypothetical protein